MYPASAFVEQERVALRLEDVPGQEVLSYDLGKVGRFRRADSLSMGVFIFA